MDTDVSSPFLKPHLQSWHEHLLQRFNPSCTSLLQIDKDHVPRFMLSDCTNTTSPIFGWTLACLWDILCLSRSAIKLFFSPTPPQFTLAFDQVLRVLFSSRSSICHGSSSESWHVRWYRIQTGVRIGSSMSSSTYVNEWLTIYLYFDPRLMLNFPSISYPSASPRKFWSFRNFCSHLLSLMNKTPLSE